MDSSFSMDKARIHCQTREKALNSLIIGKFRAFLIYCLVYMLEHVLNQFRNCLLCCKSYTQAAPHFFEIN